jgi:hypothetical protein
VMSTQAHGYIPKGKPTIENDTSASDVELYMHTSVLQGSLNGWVSYPIPRATGLPNAGIVTARLKCRTTKNGTRHGDYSSRFSINGAMVPPRRLHLQRLYDSIVSRSQMRIRALRRSYATLRAATASTARL